MAYKVANLNYNQGTWGAEQYGFLTMSYDPAIAMTNISVLSVAGRGYVQRLFLPRASVVSNIITFLMGAGSGLTSGQCMAAIYDTSGNLAGTTADQSTNWTSTGYKSMAITPVTLSSGYIWVAIHYNGTTGPAPLRGISNSVTTLNTSGTDNRYYLTTATGLTPSPSATNASTTATTTSYWMSVS